MQVIYLNWLHIINVTEHLFELCGSVEQIKTKSKKLCLVMCNEDRIGPNFNFVKKEQNLFFFETPKTNIKIRLGPSKPKKIL